MIDPRFVSDRLAENLPENERVLLVRIAEEAGEVVQAACKALRWGLDSYNPAQMERGNNLRQLLNEIDDLRDVAIQLRAQLRSHAEFYQTLREN